MFDGKTFKKTAREQLKGRLATPVLVTLFIGVLSMISISLSVIRGVIDVLAEYGYIERQSFGGISGSLVSFALGLIAAALVIPQMRVYNALFFESRKIAFLEFINELGLWWKSIRAYCWYGLWICLWACLFFIPGIIKSFSYLMMFYILAENPNIGVMKAMKISKVMTRGYKGDLFVLSLSFIGWYLLSLLTLGIGMLFLAPYIQMSFTNAYHYLKDAAIASGKLTEEDFR